MEVGTILDGLGDDPLLKGQKAHSIRVEAKKGIYSELPSWLHHRVRDRLHSLGYESLYHHQFLSAEAVHGGKDIVVVTGTNSGKTLCYALPVLDILCREPAGRALFIYPTKALAQDQMQRLVKLAPGSDIRVGTYDGDTPQAQRAALRKLGSLLLTNPDMLHIGVLPNHELWVPFLKNLKMIVLDELHTYKGAFGSNVALVLRRLLRLCEWHGNRPQIVACTATIGNPLSLFENLTGRTPELIDEDGSPQAARTYFFWNPPSLEDQETVSANYTTARVVSELATTGLRTLAFCRSRLGVELVLKMTREQLQKNPEVDDLMVESYRAGYTPEERRQIEKDLFSGKLKALIATNAMELGVDIGDLDVVVMNGYPGSVASFRQQSGRAGRGNREGLAVLIAHDDPLEQFLAREPERLLIASGENISVSPSNVHLLRPQLRCAAHERPIQASESASFTPNTLEVLEDMDRAGELVFNNGAFYYPAYEPPAPSVNLRSSDGLIRLLVDGAELGTMERWRAIQFAHEGAVYLHRGQSYLSQELDLENQIAHLRPQSVPYFTQPIVSSVIEKLAEVCTEQRGPAKLSVAAVKVTETMLAYRKKSLEVLRVLDVVDVDYPPQVFNTIAMRVDLEVPIERIDEDFITAFHGLEHALLSVAPYFAGCDPSDLGSAWYSISPDTLNPALYIFDRTPGGMGLSQQLFEKADEWLHSALHLLTSCSCSNGCPACLLSPRCEVNNEHISKKATLPLLRSIAYPDRGNN